MSNRKSIVKNRKAYTLPELMVTVIIFSLVVVGIFTILAAGNSSWQANKVKIELQQEARKVMDWMKDDLREAGASYVDLSVPADGQPYSSITFKIPYSVSGGTVSWSNDIQYALGGVNSNELQRTEGATTKTLAQNVSSLQFIRQPATPDILKVREITQEVAPLGPQVSYQLDFEVQLRN